MALNMSPPGSSQVEIQRVEKSYEADYLANIQGQGYEHLGDPLQIEFNKSIDDIRNWVLAQAMNRNADLITEVENPPTSPGQNAIIVYYIWKLPETTVPQAEPQAFACPYCTQPFMAVPGPQSQVVACPNCGGANIIPEMEIPPEPAPAALEQQYEPPPTPTPTPTPTHSPEGPPQQLQETINDQNVATQSSAPVSPEPKSQAQTQAQAAPQVAPASTTAQQPTAQTTTTPQTAPTAPPVAPQAPQAPPATTATPAKSAQTSIQTPTTTPNSSINEGEQNTTYDQDNAVPDYSQDQSYQYEDYQRAATKQYSTDMPSFDYFTKKVETDTNKPKAPLLTPEYEQAYVTKFQTVEQAIKENMQKLADLLSNPRNSVRFYDSGELMYPKITIRKGAYMHLSSREMDLLLIKDGVNDYKIIANESHSVSGGATTPMQDELFALKTLGHATYRAMEDWAYLDNEQKVAVSKCIFAFTDIYIKKIPKEEE